MYQISVETSTPIGLLYHSNLGNTTALLQLPLEAALPSALPLSQAHSMDPNLQHTIELQQASLRSAHALGFWIIGVILLAISASTGLLVCRSPRGTGRRVTANGTMLRGIWSGTSQSLTLPFCSSAARTFSKEREFCAVCRLHLQDVKQSTTVFAPQRSQSLSTISYEVDDAPPPYASLENLTSPVEARNPVLQTVIQVQTPQPPVAFCAHKFLNAHC
ncbi:uncharacterized protein LOC111251547 isoform X1 [Varroa destructor]|uniref:Uncharacterized protein n=2 Tax=Varroa destructor TaxID=109461 RepID=A0A7M7KD15_VARDE|nr:uncharacterized protein LOC111251547 isoform X1 [Varroa destructor]XP_022663951.1 uncharacterized protein LOC111251547 isoform X1 [Varroa destructor]XP_022663952.1 uncharacterized protein LOC111251547 isoform X1 [Varroa destructor]